MTKWVTIDGRRFIVEFFDNGKPRRIKERKKKNPGHPYLETIVDAPYWSFGHHAVGGPETMVSRVLAAAQEQNHENRPDQPVGPPLG